MGFFSKLVSKLLGKESNTLMRLREPYEVVVQHLTINPNRVEEVKSICNQFFKSRDKYAYVSLATGIPEDVLFAIHYREASLDFKACLHNGERIIGTGKKTKLVPKDKGPFSSWEAAAIDAVENSHHKRPAQWSLIAKLQFCESFNGMGYKYLNIPSPYVLSFTNGYVRGKYVKDEKFSIEVVDKQCGCAAIIIGLNL